MAQLRLDVHLSTPFDQKISRLLDLLIEVLSDMTGEDDAALAAMLIASGELRAKAEAISTAPPTPKGAKK